MNAISVANMIESPPASKADIARGFGKARGTYERASRLQRLMGDVLLEMLVNPSGQNGVSGRVLDLGCGTGWFTRKLADWGGGVLVTGVDLSPDMVRYARGRSPSDVAWLVADAEAVPLPEHSCDLIFSNLMIQWCADPKAVLQECRRLLRPGGTLVLSTLLDGTLTELDKAWQMADPGQRHVNRFEPEAEFRASVSRELPGARIDTENLRLPYTSPLALAAELKQLGAGYKGAGRRRTVTGPARVRAMCQYYPREPDGGVMASYEAAWVLWTCPHTGIKNGVKN